MRLLSSTGPVDLGLLVLRVGLGGMMMFHGWGKFFGGTEKWAKLGGAMEYLGISFAPTFWGFCASFAELFGGAMLMVGLLTRLNAAALAFTMLVAAAMHLGKGDGLFGSAHAIEDGIAFVALILCGAGAHSIDRILFDRS